MVRVKITLSHVVCVDYRDCILPVNGFAQTRAQLIEGAKKEGQLILSWGTGTMGGIEGAATLEKAFNKTYGLNLSIQIHSRSGDAAVCQPDYSRG